MIDLSNDFSLNKRVREMARRRRLDLSLSEASTVSCVHSFRARAVSVAELNTLPVSLVY